MTFTVSFNRERKGSEKEKQKMFAMDADSTRFFLSSYAEF